MDGKPETAAQNKENETRKPYQKPQVIAYGNILEITRNTGPKGALDGGGGAAAGPKTGT